MNELFEHSHCVRPEEIDALGRASNVAFLEWMLAAAVGHSAALGWPAEAYLARGAGWVVRSHAIDYQRPAFEGDRIVVQTWVATLDGASSIRRYKIVRGETGEVLATAETRWAFVDFRTDVGRCLRHPSPRVA